ncbi:MAG: hypothetical protein LBI44_06060 [Oscillospiraceae bacterium]|jgi:hypothetical protein|nr:hypothetical protein [Oscillospiraceae bacterium]
MATDNYADYYNLRGYADIEKEARAAAGARAEAAAEAARQKKRAVNQDAEQQARQAYIAYLRGVNALPQALAAAGHSGGVSETTLAGLEASWQEQRGQIEKSRLTALQSIDAAINESRLSGDAKLSEALASLRSQAASAWAAALEGEREREREDARQAAEAEYRRERDAASDARWESESAAKAERDEYAREWERTLHEYQKQLDAMKLALEQRALMLKNGAASPGASASNLSGAPGALRTKLG